MNCCSCGSEDVALWLCGDGVWCERCMIEAGGWPGFLPVSWWSRAINRGHRWADYFLERLRRAYYLRGLDIPPERR